MHSIDWTAVGTIALAVITAVYVYLTYKGMGETRKMAESTRDLAESSFRPDLIVTCPYHPIEYERGGSPDKHWQGSVQPRIINKGAGPAKDVRINIEGRDFHVADELPREGTAFHPELKRAQRSRKIVTLKYKDAMNNARKTRWIYQDEIGDWRAKREADNDTQGDSEE